MAGKTTLRVGLTGGIGSGKSTVARLLSKQGATVLDADAISRASTGVNGAAIASLQAAFGSAMLTAQGALDRDRMRQLIYSDPAAKARLESIVHPLVVAQMATQARQAEDAGAVCIIFDIPLLVESARWRPVLHRIVVVDCSPTQQIARIVVRDGLPAADIEKIIAAQAGRSERLHAADVVLCNDGITFDTLALQVQQIGTQFGL